MKKPPEPGIELAHYLDGHPEVDLDLSCKRCGWHEVLPMEGVVRQLLERGIDVRTFAMKAVASLVRRRIATGF